LFSEKETPVIALVADLIFASRIRAAASAAGVGAATVHRGADLEKRAREHRPRLILLDLDARGTDVPALIGTLKSDPVLKSVPVVAFGAHIETEALRTASAAGADRVLARSAFVRLLPELLLGAVDPDSGS